jgi:hypothetical protein
MQLGVQEPGWWIVSLLKRGQRYRRNKIGHAGDPWGIPVSMGQRFSFLPSNASAVMRFDKKWSTQY